MNILNTPFLQLLGTAQDGGYPQLGCTKTCCMVAWQNPALHRSPCSLAIVDPTQQKRWLLDCTPAFSAQWNRLNQQSPSSWGLSGIFLTHAHIGHYVGLVHLGKEVLCSQNLPVYTMPRMADFLTENAPWSALVESQNIKLLPLTHQQPVELSETLSVVPLLVPHRDEYSETIGFRIQSSERQMLYISDIDHWNIDAFSLEQELKDCDVAWLDGTFFSRDELPHREGDSIPHPTILESIERFSSLPASIRAKIQFFHLNHSNPLCLPDSEEKQLLLKAGFQLAEEDTLFEL